MGNKVNKRILITGGAGFIGTNLIKTISKYSQYDIHVIDNLHPQIHGNISEPNDTVRDNATFYKIDIENKSNLIRVVQDIQPNYVVHLASETGTGQSYNEISRYTGVNIQGTSNLIEALRNQKNSVEKIILTSSRAIYGEGPWLLKSGERVSPQARSLEDLKFKIYNPRYGESICEKPVGVLESDLISPASIYATTKYTQELLMTQGFMGTETKLIKLRLQNVFGPGQSPKNPYTGVLVFFANQLYNKAKLNLFEDGQITRDFIYVQDVVDALCLSLNKDFKSNLILNIGSGVGTSLINAAENLLSIFNLPKDFYSINHETRIGDIRSAWADIQKAKDILGWEPKVGFKEGLYQTFRGYVGNI